jgi:RNA polymerase sigma-70 factor (ECF subfamily)
MPEGCRRIFILNRFEKQSYKEIANTLNISIKTVENQMAKALKILRSHLLSILFLIFSTLP